MTVAAEADVAAAARYAASLDAPTLVDPQNHLAAILGYRAIPNGYLFAPDGTLLDEVVSRFDLARYPETRTIVREWMSGQPGGERTATRPDVATSVPAALALFAQGEEMLKRGERERALAKWHAAYLADPESFVIRKQIWRVLYPDRFGETIDLDWQRAQTAREKELGFAQANPSLPPPA